MEFYVAGEHIEASTAGKPMEEVVGWIGMVVHPRLGTLARMAQDGRLAGGVAAGSGP
jgi:hypothetical protein